jgi:catechol 2,3-dioxygenase-like lactoylglutathione lyase family enzyme
MSIRLEHANIAVRDIDGMIQFLQTAFPEFRIRGGGQGTTGHRWVHVGTDDNYLALNEATVEPERQQRPYTGEPGVNHLGYEVDDVDALRARLLAVGYGESTVPNAHPHRKRVYFYDPEGNDWEFVQYFSDDPAERNDYDLPDR